MQSSLSAHVLFRLLPTISSELVEMSTFDVLLEIDGFRKELTLNRENALFIIEQEVGKLGKDVCLASLSTRDDSSKVVYFLQRWAKRWKAFVDVTDVSQILNGDRLTVTRHQASPRAAFGFDTARGEVKGDCCLIIVCSLSGVIVIPEDG